MTSQLTRRQFLGLAGGAAGAATAGTLLWSRLLDDQVRNSTITSSSSPAHNRVLVVVECQGGNDGLNTLVPAGGRYRDERPTLSILEEELVPLQGEADYSFHPALAPLAPVWAAGQLGAFQGVGLHGQTLSHPAATDIWRAGGGVPGGSSWLGRWLDATLGDEQEPLRAIAIRTDTGMLAAERALSTVIMNPDSFTLNIPPGPSRVAEAVVAAFEATSYPLASDPWFRAVQEGIPPTLDAVEVLAQATAPPDSSVSNSPAEERRFSSSLDTAARIIDLDVGTKVLVIGADGFDTHSAQANRHQALLSDLGTGLSRFLDSMEEQGRADDVLVLTTSEFGRRVAENGSAGSDHGAASMALVLGGAVNR